MIVLQGLANNEGLLMIGGRADLDLATIWPGNRMDREGTEDCNVKDKGLRKKKTFLFPSLSFFMNQFVQIIWFEIQAH